MVGNSHGEDIESGAGEYSGLGFFGSFLFVLCKAQDRGATLEVNCEGRAKLAGQRL